MRRLPSAKFLYILLFIVLISFAQSQTDTLVIATYNLLNYPGSDAAVRNPYFRRVIHSMKPDVLFVQEITSQAGVTTFLNEVMNKYQPGLYSTVPFYDGPDTDNSFYYRSDKVTFLGAYYISTALRVIAEYTFRHNSSGEVIRIYSLHLKASQGYEQDRLAEVTILRNYLNNLPSGTNFIVGGDFNIYASTEPAYQKLTGSEADNDGRCFDPKPITGVWNQGIYAIHHTQSSRLRSFGGGTTGGLDDRFDMQLISQSLLDNIINSSYKAYGNDGYHYNDSINKLPNYAVPDSVAHGLHYASDHIPVVAKYVFSSLTSFNLISPPNNSVQLPVNGTLVWNRSIGATSYDVYLSTSNPPTLIVSSDQTDTTYNYSGLLYNTKYYWKVVAKKLSSSLEANGSPYNFTTIVPAPPSAFNLISPTDNSSEQPRSGVLSWSASSTANSYDVYLDTVANPTTIISSNQSATTYSYQNLIANKTYFWKVVAKNEFGTTQASNSPWRFTIANVPLAPTNLLIYSKGYNQIHLKWEDNAYNELGYRVYRVNGGTKINISGDLPVNTSSFIANGLTPNTEYVYEVLAFNEQGEGNFATVQTYTLAQSPSFLTLYPYGISALYLDINPLNNPTYTSYAILATTDTSSENYVQADGSLGSNKYWQTLSNWQATGPIRILNLPSGTLFYIKILAKNQEGIESSSAFDTISTQTFFINSNIDEGWNLVSVPVQRTDLRKITIFPDASSRTFAFNNGYIVKDTLEYGKGYWIKYNSAKIIELSGVPILCDTIYLQPGWNLIGSISEPIAVNKIIQVPPNLIVSNVYAYGGGYLFADTIFPSYGYWLKASEEGYLIIDKNSQKTNNLKSSYFKNSGLNKITFTLNNGWKQTLYFSQTSNSNSELYELPPIPPGDANDVRFESSLIVSSFESKKESKILIKSKVPGLYIDWDICDNKVYELLDETGNLLAKLSKNGSLKINQIKIDKLILRENISDNYTTLSSGFKLLQNYPNPFNNTTLISYSIPEDAFVVLEVYDLLGGKIATLVNQYKIAGNYNVSFDATNLPGGIYFYKLNAGMHSEFRKMILIK